MSLWYWEIVADYQRAQRQASYLPFLRDVAGQIQRAVNEPAEARHERYLAELATVDLGPAPFERPTYHLPPRAIDAALHGIP